MPPIGFVVVSKANEFVVGRNRKVGHVFNKRRKVLKHVGRCQEPQTVSNFNLSSDHLRRVFRLQTSDLKLQTLKFRLQTADLRRHPDEQKANYDTINVSIRLSNFGGR